MVQAPFVAEFVDEGVEDIAAGVGLVRLGIVEALSDADISAGRKGAAVIFLAQFRAHHFQIVQIRIEWPIVDDLELERRRRRPLLQRADGSRLVFGMIV